MKPDFKTIADFRSNNRAAFKKVFREFVILCRRLDLFGRELLAVDSTRIKARPPLTMVSKTRRIPQEGLKAMIRTILSLISIPVMLLNFGGGIVGGIWLIILGDWSLIGLGVASMFVSSFGLALVLMPSMLFAGPGALALDRRKYVIGSLCLLLANVWTLAVMTVWCVGCFHLVLGSYYHGGSIWPFLLWAYGMATGPWTYMAARGGSDEIGSRVSAFGACIGAMAIMGVALFKSYPSIIDFAIAFCVPISAVLLFQVVIGVMLVKERPQLT